MQGNQLQTINPTQSPNVNTSYLIGDDNKGSSQHNIISNKTTAITDKSRYFSDVRNTDMLNKPGGIAVADPQQVPYVVQTSVPSTVIDVPTVNQHTKYGGSITTDNSGDLSIVPTQAPYVNDGTVVNTMTDYVDNTIIQPHNVRPSNIVSPRSAVNTINTVDIGAIPDMDLLSVSNEDMYMGDTSNTDTITTSNHSYAPYTYDNTVKINTAAPISEPYAPVLKESSIEVREAGTRYEGTSIDRWEDTGNKINDTLQVLNKRLAGSTSEPQQYFQIPSNSPDNNITLATTPIFIQDIGIVLINTGLV